MCRRERFMTGNQITCASLSGKPGFVPGRLLAGIKPQPEPEAQRFCSTRLPMNRPFVLVLDRMAWLRGRTGSWPQCMQKTKGTFHETRPDPVRNFSVYA